MAPGLMENEAPNMESSLMLEKVGTDDPLLCANSPLVLLGGVDVMHHVTHLVRAVSSQKNTRRKWLWDFKLKQKLMLLA